MISTIYEVICVFVSCYQYGHFLHLWVLAEQLDMIFEVDVPVMEEVAPAFEELD